MLSQQNYSKIIAKTWSDAAFRQRFLSDPKSILRENGIEIPDSVDVSVKEGTGAGRIELELPPRPANIEDSDVHRRLEGRVCF